MDHASKIPVAAVVHGFPATDMIKVLLHHIGANIKTSTSNCELTNQLYFVSNAYYAGIQIRMQKVDRSKSAEWTFFEEYTLAIPHLESTLLSFSLQNINYGPQALPPNDGVAVALGFIEKWDSDRNTLDAAWASLAQDDLLRLVALDVEADQFMNENPGSDKFQLLQDGLSALDEGFYYHPSSSAPEMLEYFMSTYDEARSSDDASLISALHEYTRTSSLKESDIMQAPGETLLSSVKDVSKQMKELTMSIWLTDPAITRIVIKTMILAYIPFTHVDSPKISQAWRDYLRSRRVWTALKMLLGKVCRHLTLSQTSTIAALEEEWATVARVLLDLSETKIDTTDELLRLLRLVANIRRPFHGRSAELTKMLYHLDVVSALSSDEKSLRQRKSLKAVMAKTIASLTVTQKTVSDVKAIRLTAADYEYQNIESRKCLNQIKLLFSSFNLENEWPPHELAYDAAVKVDEEHLKLMKRRLGLST